jgi:competence protein ComEC
VPDKLSISDRLTAREKLRTVPLLGVLAAMTAGIAAGLHLGRVPLYVWAACCVICAAAAWWSAATGRAELSATVGSGGSKRAFRRGRAGGGFGNFSDFGGAMAGVYTTLAVAFFGAGLARLHTPVAVVPQGERVWLRMAIDDAPTYREGRRSAQATGRVTEWQPDNLTAGTPSGGWLRGGDRLLVSIDTMWSLAAGDRVTFRGYVNPVDGENGDGAATEREASAKQSHTSSYGRLMRARGYVGRTYISQYSRPSTTPTATRSPRAWAKRLQSAATERLMRLGAEWNQTAVAKGDGSAQAGVAIGGGDRRPTATGEIVEAIAVAAAMTTGDRGGLTPKLRRAYSRTGASHLLAVSGLHVGIVFMIINALLYLMPLVRGGHIAKNMLAAAAVWGYAAMTGLSPSATRAAFMFTGAQAALATSRARNPANVMCATALVMLAVKPGLVGDISFQLSFVAVAAILAWFGPLYRLVAGRSRVANVLWGMLIVGFVASTATLPLVSHTFGVFSPVGVVLNPIVVTTAHLTVAASLVWIAVPWDIWEPVFRWLVVGPAWLQNRTVELVGAVPGAAVEWTMPLWAVWATYAAMAALTAWYHLAPRRREPFRLPR